MPFDLVTWHTELETNITHIHEHTDDRRRKARHLSAFSGRRWNGDGEFDGRSEKDHQKYSLCLCVYEKRQESIYLKIPSVRTGGRSRRSRRRARGVERNFLNSRHLPSV